MEKRASFTKKTLRSLLIPALFLFFALIFNPSPAAACPSGTVDVLNYFLPSGMTKGNRMQNGEIFYTYAATVADKSGFYIIKSDDPHYYEAYNYDGSYIYIVYDTTWATGENQNVTCKDDGTDALAVSYGDDGSLGYPRFPRCMAPGKEYYTSGSVTGMSKVNCHICETAVSGGHSGSMRLAHQGAYTLPTGISFDDVITLPGSNGETEILARGYGRVGWTGPFTNYMVGQDSAPSEAAPLCGDPSGSGKARCSLAQGVMSTSRDLYTYDMFVEEDKNCSGNFLSSLVCHLKMFAKWVLEGIHRVGVDDALRAFWYKERSTPSPGYFKGASRAILRMTGTERKYDGIIARMLAPDYTQDGSEAVPQLVDAEGQFSEGYVTSNQEAPESLSQGTGELTMEFFGPGYVVPALFPWIPALKDRFALITQTFVPGSLQAIIPRVECGYPTGEDIIPIQDTHRIIGWELDEAAHGEEKSLSCEKTNPNDPDCNGVYEDGNCPCKGKGESTVSAHLSSHTEVALTSETWSNIAGGGAFLDAFKPPSMTDYRYCIADAKTTAQAVYRSETVNDVNQPADLAIKHLGGISGALNCVMNGMLMPPSTADKNACEDVLIKGKKLKCSQPPPCWAGSPNNVRDERGSECPSPYNRCTTDKDHEIIPACTFGFDPETDSVTLFCYGNNYRACATHGAFPEPSIGQKRSGWISVAEFGAGVLYNGYTYTAEDIPGSYSEEIPWTGVFWCDSNSYGCLNPVCYGGAGIYAPCKDTLVATDWVPESASLAAELNDIPAQLGALSLETEITLGGKSPRQEEEEEENFAGTAKLSYRQTSNANFWNTLGTAIAKAIKKLISL